MLISCSHLFLFCFAGKINGDDQGGLCDYLYFKLILGESESSGSSFMWKTSSLWEQAEGIKKQIRSNHPWCNVHVTTLDRDITTRAGLWH